MKGYILKIKVFFMLLIMSGLLLACSDDDTEDEKQFLEVHGGTVWKYGEPEDGLSVYAQINNSTSEPFEIWRYLDGQDCYDYQSITDDGSPEVIENRENKVEIRIGGDSGDYGVLTMTVAGNLLRVEIETFEDGEFVEDQKFVLQRTEEDPSSLEICT